MLAALQRGIPLAKRPFDILSREIGCSEADLIAAIANLRREGKVRRFGAVFDTRRLGYRTALCCRFSDDAEVDAQALISQGEVSHCYERVAEGCPNLWWTWSAPEATFDDSLRKIPFPFQLLPAKTRYKVDVIFGGASAAYEERVADDLPPPDDSEKAIVRAMAGDTEIRGDYFAGIADKVGMKEWDLLSRLEIWRRNGRLKRIGLLLNHRKAGYVANGMCCFAVDGDTTEAGRLLAARGEVTHCYEREAFDGFPYNLYAMIHCTSENEANIQFSALKDNLCKLVGYEVGAVMLVSRKEFKKKSLAFYEDCDIMRAN